MLNPNFKIKISNMKKLYFLTSLPKRYIFDIFATKMSKFQKVYCISHYK